MFAIKWHEPNSRIYEAGLDRGVLYPKFKTGVAWNGLTAVDENGGEGTTVYFLDGRPYLISPKKKEFSASLKAITYPDEFSDYMGLEKVATGLYFDSQQGDTFGLSYRTLVGDENDGLDLGYKIHLVYNCVVVPDTIGHASIGGDIAPSEFSWQIQATPVRIPGYHPTAHIIIDTRGLEQAVIDQLEELIYGATTPPDLLMDGGDPGPGPDLDADGGDESPVDPDTEIADGGGPFTSAETVTMPDPQTILDILSYGDDIIITYLGDGFWSAAGAYRNVHPIGDGLFEINNVDAIDHGDGTFTVSTTLAP